jgi:putative methyltransferase (TIGR04325 family)
MVDVMKFLKRFARNWLPPGLISIYRFLFTDGIRFVGHYASWRAASDASTGYDTDTILARVSAASAKVKSGEAVYERDSVLFDKVEHSFPLLAVLMKAAAEKGGKLTVLDFGGSLGSSYFQCKHFLPDDLNLNWCVVEQEKFVRRGREAFASNELQFFFSIQECMAQHKPDVVLFASVLQYLEHADQIVDAAVATGAEYIAIDRTPFIALDTDWLCVQHVPASIYKASYPCAVLSVSRLKQQLCDRFVLVAEFDGLGGWSHIRNGVQQIPFQYKGMIWQRR